MDSISASGHGRSRQDGSSSFVQWPKCIKPLLQGVTLSSSEERDSLASLNGYFYSMHCLHSGWRTFLRERDSNAKKDLASLLGMSRKETNLRWLHAACTYIRRPTYGTTTRPDFLRPSRIRVDLLLYDNKLTDKREQYDWRDEKYLNGYYICRSLLELVLSDWNVAWLTFR